MFTLFDSPGERLLIYGVPALFLLAIFIVVLVKLRWARQLTAIVSLVSIDVAWIAVIAMTFGSGPATNIWHLDLWYECVTQYSDGSETTLIEVSVEDARAAGLPIPERAENGSFEVMFHAVGARWVGAYERGGRAVLVGVEDRPSAGGSLGEVRTFQTDSYDRPAFRGEHVVLARGSEGVRVLDNELHVVANHTELDSRVLDHWQRDADGKYWFLEGRDLTLTGWTPPTTFTQTSISLRRAQLLAPGPGGLCVTGSGPGRFVTLDPPALRELGPFELFIDRHYTSGWALAIAFVCSLVLFVLFVLRVRPFVRARLAKRPADNPYADPVPWGEIIEGVTPLGLVGLALALAPLLYVISALSSGGG